jgi:hypothetical protein
MLTLFLFLVIVAIALGIVGAVANGLFFLLIIAIVVFLLAFVLLAFGGSPFRRDRPAR